jgi:hypothetical protein
MNFCDFTKDICIHVKLSLKNLKINIYLFKLIALHNILHHNTINNMVNNIN